MGKRVHWKEKVRNFINYSESYDLLQFKKSVLEASSLVQLHYFLTKLFGQTQESSNKQFVWKKVKLKFTGFINYN